MSILRWKAQEGEAKLSVVSGPGAICELNHLAEEHGLSGKAIAVWDDDTWQSVSCKPEVFRNILFDSEQLFCDDQALEYLRKQSTQEGDFLFAIGGEAIQSITKLVAAESGMPYIAAPTCAFGTGIASAWAQKATCFGMKRMHAVLPVAIAADTQLMAAANESIAAGAVRELTVRAGLLAQARTCAVAAGYPWDQSWMDRQTEAMERVFRICNGALRRKTPEAFGILCEALIRCGIAGEPGTDYPARLNFLSEYK